MMSQAVIKVIKRNIKNAEQKPQLAAEVLKAAKNDQRKMIDTVNDWITERRANSRAEEAVSVDSILAWKLISCN